MFAILTFIAIITAMILFVWYFLREVKPLPVDTKRTDETDSADSQIAKGIGFLS